MNLTAPVVRPTRSVRTPPAGLSWVPSGGLEWLLVAGAFGTAFLDVPLPYNLAPVDLAFLVINAVGLMVLVTRRGPTTAVFRRALPWFWLLGIGTAASLFGVGFAGWAIDQTLRNFGAVLTFFALSALLEIRPAAARKVGLALLAAGTAVAASVLFEAATGVRATGPTFRNPNYTGHFLAAALLLLGAGVPRSMLARALLASLFMAGIVRTGSFGAIAVLLGALATWLWLSPRHLPRGPAAAARLLAAAGIAVALSIGLTQTDSPEFDAGSGFSSERLDRSRTTRFELWENALRLVPEHPLGVGPGGVHNRRLLGGPGTHSDPILFLVETGALGLLGLAGIVGVIWRAGAPTGLVPVVVCAFAFGSLFREVINFRHMWVVLAVLFARDLATRQLSVEGG